MPMSVHHPLSTVVVQPRASALPLVSPIWTSHSIGTSPIPAKTTGTTKKPQIGSNDGESCTTVNIDGNLTFPKPRCGCEPPRTQGLGLQISERTQRLAFFSIRFSFSPCSGRYLPKLNMMTSHSEALTVIQEESCALRPLVYCPDALHTENCSSELGPVESYKMSGKPKSGTFRGLSGHVHQMKFTCTWVGSLWVEVKRFRTS
jgi:hypothetical protein